MKEELIIDFKIADATNKEVFGNIETASKRLEVERASSDEGGEDYADSVLERDHIGLLPIYGDLAIINELNQNDFAVTASEAVRAKGSLNNKPVNLEHDKQQIVGHIFDCSFSLMKNSWVRIYDEWDIKDFEYPFYFNYAAFIYNNAYPNLVDLIFRSNDPEDEYFGVIKSSWEVSFDSYDIVIMPNETESRLAMAERVITSEEDDYEFYKKILKREGGSGKHQGKRVGRILKNIEFLASALTINPAADVDGITELMSVVESRKEDSEKSNEYVRYKAVASLDSNGNHFDIFGEKNKKDEKNFQNKKPSVKTNTKNTMNIEDIKKAVSEELAKLNPAKADDKVATASFEEQASSVLKTFSDAIDKGSEKWKADIDAEKASRETAEAEVKSLAEKVEKLEGDIKQAREEAQASKEALDIRAKAEALTQRMSSITSKFDLNEAEEAIVSQEVASLADEAGFEDYMKKVDIIFGHKNKEISKGAQEEQASKEEEQKTEEKEEEVASISTEGKVEGEVPSSSAPQKTLIERIKEQSDSFASIK